jgi:hypothetical protein
MLNIKEPVIASLVEKFVNEFRSRLPSHVEIEILLPPSGMIEDTPVVVRLINRQSTFRPILLAENSCQEGQEVANSFIRLSFMFSSLIGLIERLGDMIRVVDAIMNDCAAEGISLPLLFGLTDMISIGNTDCAFNAKSPHVRCAVNPSGPCESCLHFETQD